MGSRFLIAAILSTACALASSQLIGREWAVQKAHSFARFMNSGEGHMSILLDFSGPVKNVRRANGRWHVEFEKCSVGINDRTGNAEYYHCQYPNNFEYQALSSPNMGLSNAACLDIARRVFREAGFEDELTLYSREDFMPAEGIYGLQVWLRRTRAGIEFDTAFCPTFTFHPLAGQVLDYSMTPDPILPPGILPRITLSQANSVVLTALGRFVPNGVLSVFERHPLRLRFWYPGLGKTVFEDLPFDWERYFREWRTVLAYDVRYEDESYVMPPGRGPALWHFVVDAISGRLLVVEEPDPGFGAGPIRLRTFGWDLGPGPIAVTVGGKTHELSHADVLKVQQASPNEPGVPVLLQRARLILNALYYPKANLLSVGEGKLRSFGRPDEELKKALLALAAKE